MSKTLLMIKSRVKTKVTSPCLLARYAQNWILMSVMSAKKCTVIGTAENVITWLSVRKSLQLFPLLGLIKEIVSPSYIITSVVIFKQ